MLKPVAQFQEELKKLPKYKKEKRKQEQFCFLLDMIPTIINHAYFDRLEVCGKDKQADVKAYLRKLGIDSKETLEESIRYNYRCGMQYEQFMTFWEGNPCFDMEKLPEESRAYFAFCMECAEAYRPYVGTYGFHAWDISEAIHRIREAYTCQYLKEEEARKQIQAYVDLARRVFYCFEDYAISYICGSMYYMKKESKNEEHVKNIRDTMLRICRHLFFDEQENVWARVSWLAQSVYFKDLEEIKDMHLAQGSMGCFVTDRVSVEGKRIAYFYREKGMSEFADSGWRFFAGDESEEYLNDPKHTHIFSLNTIANAFPELTVWLKEPIGSAIALGKDGKYYTISTKEQDDEKRNF